MRLAVLSDIHGNALALDAVLADIRAAGGVDTCWVLGDLVAIGPDPIGVLTRLDALPQARYVRGNTDRYTAAGLASDGAVAGGESEIELDRLRASRAGAELLASLAWTQGAVTAVGRLDWLAALPVELRDVLPDGTRVLAVHAAPGTDDGPGISLDTRDDEIARMVDGCDAELVFVAHTHHTFDRRVGGVRVVNSGSVSNPAMSHLCATYSIVTADERGYDIEPRRVAYDREAVIGLAQRVRFPGTQRVIAFMRGEMARH